MRLATLLVVVGAASVSATFEQDILALVQPIVDAKAKEYNCTIAAAMHFHNGTRVAAIAGDKDYVKKIPAELTDKFVWGSVTKVVTGTNILKAQEDGLLNVNDSIVPYINPILKRMAAKDPSMKHDSLQGFFGDEVEKVTINNLARMRSGIPDYDTAKPDSSPPTDKFRKDCYAKPEDDYAPQDMMGVSWVATGKLDFPPDSKESYSSTNFVLLGLLLAEVYNATSWETFDQASVIPTAAQQDTSFAVTGAPSEFAAMHGYDRTSYNGNPPNEPPGIDVSDIHCVYAGWTASDYTASVQDAADLTYDVYGPDSPILSAATQEWRKPKSFKEFYAFSTFNLQQFTGLSPFSKYSDAYGHLGATYGYDSIVFYYPELQFSLAIASNIETTTQAQPADTQCSVYNVVRAHMLGKDPLDCKYEAGHYFGVCKCKI